MDRFEAVANIRQCTRYNHAHGVIEIRGLHFVLDRHRLDIEIVRRQIGCLIAHRFISMLYGAQLKSTTMYPNRVFSIKKTYAKTGIRARNHPRSENLFFPGFPGLISLPKRNRCVVAHRRVQGGPGGRTRHFAPRTNWASKRPEIRFHGVWLSVPPGRWRAQVP